MMNFDSLEKNKFKCIYLDPPWSFKTYSKPEEGAVPSRVENQHYKTLNIEEIKKLPLYDLAAKDCWIFLWSIDSFHPEAMNLLQHWGFKYSSVAFYWVKTNRGSATKKFFTQKDLFTGMGYTTRSNIEICWLAKKGSPRIQDHSVEKAVLEPVMMHSKKPSCVYKRIERLCEGPYIELFSRSNRKGWESWGDETGKLDSSFFLERLTEQGESDTFNMH